MSASEWVLGVDGGGSKTVAWLAPQTDAAATDCFVGGAGPSNPRTVAFDAAAGAVREAIDAAFRAAGRPASPVAALCLAIAGSDQPASRQRWLDWAHQQSLAEQVVVSNDAEPILACLPTEHGVGLIAGTGSFALGRSPTGEMARAGGWGYRAGDEGSGYALATAALAAVARYADGRGPQTVLLDLLLRHFGAGQPRDLIDRIYSPEMDRRAIAQAAPLVLQAAERNDEVAVRLCDSAAEELSLLVCAVQRQLELAPRPLPLAMAGSILVHHPAFRQRVEAALQRAGLTVDVVVVQEPAAGAVVLARRAAFNAV